MHPADLADERARRAKLRLSALRMILRHAVTNAKPEDIPVLEAVVDAANAGLIGIDDAEDILKTFRRQHAA